MERTPFDPDAPPAQILDDEPDAPDLAPVDAPDLTPAPDTNSRGLPRWFWPVFGAIVLVFAMIGAGIWTGQRTETARLAALRERVNSIARNDNALVLEVLDADGSQHITYAEFFDRAAKNKADRDVLIRKLRTLVADPYQTEVDNLVRLLEIENDYVRAEEAVTRQKLEVARRRDALQQIAEANADAQTGLEPGAPVGENAPYVAPSGEEWNRQAIESGRLAGAAFRRYKTARAAMGDKLQAAALAIDNWLGAEPKLYPVWAPPREVTDALQAKKRRYTIAAPDSSADPNAPLNPDPNATAAPDFNAPPVLEQNTPEPFAPQPTPQPTEAPTPEPTPEPTETLTPELTPTEQPTPTDAAPTREDAPDPLAGERFSQTRLRALNSDELKGLSDDDLRYATNEMFARYGQTFGDKNYQAQFQSAPWYRPNPALGSAQIRRAFSDLEKSNLKLLIKERARRKKSGGY